ncbi:MAG: DUF1232 domain-containing protein [Anaerolineae bacterium]|nr:DUF1232 domain-containing protein [Anaerolineae bacterium]
MSDQDNKKNDISPSPWGSDPIRGLNYDYLDIDKPPSIEPKPVMPERTTRFNAIQAQDFYQRIRGKLVTWAQGAGAGKEATNYILLIPDIMALFVRLMGDPRVSGALKAEIAAASAYVISPIDLMPEAVMGPAGLIDDAIVAVIALNRVVAAMGQAGEDVLRQYWDGDQDILVVIKDLLTRADSFVSGTVWTGIKKFVRDTVAEKPSEGQIIEGKARPIEKPRFDK